MDLNRIQLTGRLDREPLLYDVGDHHVAALHLVSERRWQTPSGASERSHEYYRLTAWEDLADECGRLLHAGDFIYVVGRLRLFSSWIGGMEHTAHEILLERLALLANAGAHAETLHRHATIRGRSRSLVPFEGGHLALPFPKPRNESEP
jgi:hypothetical protein